MEIPVKINNTYEIEIVDLNHKGQGVAKIDGFTIFLDRGIPGDIGKVKIISVKKNYGIGKFISLEQKSKDRIDPICEVEHICGGCQIQSIDYNKQLEIKKNIVINNIKRIGGLENVLIHDTIGMENPYRYRNKAQFPVKSYDNKIDIGFYKINTHEIVDTEKCYIQHDVNDEVTKLIKEYMVKFNVSGYDEKSGTGIIRHILTKTSFRTNDVMVVIITNGNKLPYKEELIEILINNIKSTCIFSKSIFPCDANIETIAMFKKYP